jgi:rfaE bifunctional protein kinase chain/domain
MPPAAAPAEAPPTAAPDGGDAPAVLVVGDSMLDRYWNGAVERISPEAPVPVLQLRDQSERAGGAANVALNLAALGCRVTLATLLGEDAAAARLATLLAQAGVTLDAVRSADLVTTQKIRAVCRQHQLLRVDIERPAAAAPARALHDRVTDLLRHHPIVLLSDYGKGAIHDAPGLIRRAGRHGARVLADPKGSDFSRYAHAWLLKPNESEAASAAGRWDDEPAFVARMEALRAGLPVQHLLVTRGERGMSLFSAGRSALHVPTRAREVYDVSGAGDTALAALASALAGGAGLDDAMRDANLAAGLAVAKFGTAIVTRAELDRARSSEPYASA